MTRTQLAELSLLLAEEIMRNNNLRRIVNEDLVESNVQLVKLHKMVQSGIIEAKGVDNK